MSFQKQIEKCNGPVCLLDLPEEMLISIFAFLRVFPENKELFVVCKEFYQVLRHQATVKYLFYSHFGVPFRNRQSEIKYVGSNNQIVTKSIDWKLFRQVGDDVIRAYKKIKDDHFYSQRNFFKKFESEMPLFGAFSKCCYKKCFTFAMIITEEIPLYMGRWYESDALKCVMRAYAAVKIQSFVDHMKKLCFKFVTPNKLIYRIDLNPSSIPENMLFWICQTENIFLDNMCSTEEEDMCSTDVEVIEEPLLDIPERYHLDFYCSLVSCGRFFPNKINHGSIERVKFVFEYIPREYQATVLQKIENLRIEIHNVKECFVFLEKQVPKELRCNVFRHFEFIKNIQADDFEKCLKIMPQPILLYVYKCIFRNRERKNQIENAEINFHQYEKLISVVKEKDPGRQIDIFQAAFPFIKSSNFFVRGREFGHVRRLYCVDAIQNIGHENRIKVLMLPYDQENQEVLIGEEICSLIETPGELIEYIRLFTVEQQSQCIFGTLRKCILENKQGGTLDNVRLLVKKSSFDVLATLILLKTDFGKCMLDDIESNQKLFRVVIKKVENEFCDDHRRFLIYRLRHALLKNDFNKINEWIKAFQNNKRDNSNRDTAEYFALLVKLIELLRPSFLNRWIRKNITDINNAGKMWKKFEEILSDYLKRVDVDGNDNNIEAACQFKESLEDFSKNMQSRKAKAVLQQIIDKIFSFHDIENVSNEKEIKLDFKK